MKNITTKAIYLLFLCSVYFAGYFVGTKDIDKIKDQHTIEKQTLLREYEKIQMQKYAEAKYFEERINAIYGSSAYNKFRIILQSMDAPDGQR